MTKKEFKELEKFAKKKNGYNDCPKRYMFKGSYFQK